jgi:hypothetical protein
MIASWLNQTVYVASVTGIDAYGKPTYGTPTARKVRLELIRRMVLKATGEEAVANHRLWTLSAINLTDRIWLPGANTSLAEQSNLPMTLSSSPDKSGSRTLYKVEF